MSLDGRLTFDPLNDMLTTPAGKTVKLNPPKKAEPLPKKGFVFSHEGYSEPAADGSAIKVAVRSGSDRLQAIAPFAAWDGKDFEKLPVLLKAKGKCTTDHISPAGPWLKYRGHLDKISDNAFIGAINSFAAEAGHGINVVTGESEVPLPKIARHYKGQGLRWVAVGDENYGEGSSREHAAMTPRYLGCAAVITRSFARIHETNLKKQGVLPLTFADPKDYDKIQATDRISVTGLKNLKPAQPLQLVLHHADGKTETVSARHSLTATQIGWFQAGSALNALGQPA